jgi:hypothetical protein
MSEKDLANRVINVEKLLKEFSTIKVKLLSLLGEDRNKANAKSVIRNDMSSLQTLSDIQKRSVTVAPTADDFNQLAEDVARIGAVLDAIAVKLRS